MDVSTRVISVLALLSEKLIRLLHLGAGSTWPGHIALKADPQFISHILKRSRVKIVLIAGTNGKTTTSTLLRHLLERQGYKVFQNNEGANLLNGVASSLIRNSNPFTGGFKGDVAIFEVDENSLPKVIEQTNPSSVILLNLFRDQLDRYGEVNIIADKWADALQHLSEKAILIINGDDPQLVYSAKQSPAHKVYFSIAQFMLDQKSLSHDVDSSYCPSCGTQLEYDAISYSHLGNYRCVNCGFKRPKVETFEDVVTTYTILGKYNIYNTHAVLAALKHVFDIKTKELSLDQFQPAFGRQERLEIDNRTVYIMLSKNPVGFNQSAAVSNQLLKGKQGNILLVLNDRIPDGRDVSWIWDVNFEMPLQGLKLDTIYVSGDRVYDMALRMKYMDIKNVKTYEILEHAVDEVIERTPIGGTVVILPTYSAMLEVRKILVGRKLL